MRYCLKNGLLITVLVSSCTPQNVRMRTRSTTTASALSNDPLLQRSSASSNICEIPKVGVAAGVVSGSPEASNVIRVGDLECNQPPIDDELLPETCKASVSLNGNLVLEAVAAPEQTFQGWENHPDGIGRCPDTCTSSSEATCELSSRSLSTIPEDTFVYCIGSFGSENEESLEGQVALTYRIDTSGSLPLGTSQRVDLFSADGRLFSESSHLDMRHWLGPNDRTGIVCFGETCYVYDPLATATVDVSADVATFPPDEYLDCAYADLERTDEAAGYSCNWHQITYTQKSTILFSSPPSEETTLIEMEYSICVASELARFDRKYFNSPRMFCEQQSGMMGAGLGIKYRVVTKSMTQRSVDVEGTRTEALDGAGGIMEQELVRIEKRDVDEEIFLAPEINSEL